MIGKGDDQKDSEEYLEVDSDEENVKFNDVHLLNIDEEKASFKSKLPRLNLQRKESKDEIKCDELEDTFRVREPIVYQKRSNFDRLRDTTSFYSRAKSNPLEQQVLRNNSCCYFDF